MGRRIENEGLLDLAKEEIPAKRIILKQICVAQVVFVSRSRSRSTDLNGGRKTMATLARRQMVEHFDQTRNFLKPRKSLAPFKDCKGKRNMDFSVAEVRVDKTESDTQGGD